LPALKPIVRNELSFALVPIALNLTAGGIFVTAAAKFFGDLGDIYVAF